MTYSQRLFFVYTNVYLDIKHIKLLETEKITKHLPVLS